MTVFAVLQSDPTEALGGVVQREFPQGSRRVGAGQWLISAPSNTTREIGERLGCNNGEFGQVLIVTIGNYWGWHNQDLWEWLQSRTAKNG